MSTSEVPNDDIVLDMNEAEHHSGGCRCGAIRYHFSGTPVMVEYCHCDSCRKASGSVVASVAGFRREGFNLISGNPTYFESAPGVKRSFCGVCGSPLFYENEDYPDEIYVSLGSFDRLEELPPDRHDWTSDKIGWYRIGDDLPQYAQFSGTGSAKAAVPYKKSD